MTANELADELERMIPALPLKALIKSATMLRQQEAELNEAGHMICMLRWEIGELKEQLTKDTECQYCKQGCFRCDARKALTDEEIEEVARPYCDLQNWVVDKHEFARAILKKASERA